MSVPQISVQQAATWLSEGVTILDVRETWELQLAAVEGARHIPMSQITGRVGELDPTARVAVLCHHGMRSWQVAMFLAQQGFGDVHNISGGIAAWAELDPGIGTY